MSQAALALRDTCGCLVKRLSCGVQPAHASEQVPAPSIFGEPTKTLSVVVPAYNEEERLAPMLEEMLAYLQKRRDRQVGARKQLPAGCEVSGTHMANCCLVCLSVCTGYQTHLLCWPS